VGRKLVDAKIIGIDHYTIHVKDLVASIHFYTEVVGFALMPRPSFDFEGAWFAINDTQSIHLIKDEKSEVASGSRQLHFAFKVGSLDDIIAISIEMDLDFLGPKTRPDGVKSIFVKDPSGYFLEFVDQSLI